MGNLSENNVLNCKLDADDERLRVTVDSRRLFEGKVTKGREAYEPLGDL